MFSPLHFSINALTTCPERPWVLDLFCGAGGSAMGYWMAGYNVLGVDIKAQPNYPFWFIRSNATVFAAKYGEHFDLIHASPPCQAYSEMKHFTNREYPKLIPAIRLILQSLKKPYVIENVRGAARDLEAPIILCGAMFGLKTYRHRYFEVNPWILAPGHPRHDDAVPSVGTGVSLKRGIVSVAGAGGKRIPRDVLIENECDTETDYLRLAMGMAWANRDELAEAIPPAYTYYIGKQLFRVIDNAKAS